MFFVFFVSFVISMNSPPTHVVEIAANLDDASGEVIGAAVETLLIEGALDVWTSAISMKKQRPGVMVSLLCAPEDRDRLARRLMELTGSFGVRYRPWDRLVLDRRHETAQTPFGPIRIKIGSLDGQAIAAKPEYEDVHRAAQTHGVTLRQVLESVRGLGGTG